MLYYYSLDYDEQLLVHAICLAVLLLSLYYIVIVSLNEINGDRDGYMPYGNVKCKVM